MDFERRDFGGKRKRAQRFRLFIVPIVLIILFSIGWYKHSFSPVDTTSNRSFTVTIPAGASFSYVVSQLLDNDIIRSSHSFAFHAWWNGQDRLIRAGTYVVRPSMSSDEILHILTGGAKGEVGVTIPEGFTVADIDRLMAEKGFTATGAVIACAKTCDFSGFAFLPIDRSGPGGNLEGYLYPDTYFVGGEGSDPRAFLSRLLSTFQAKVMHGLKDDIAASKKPFHDIITMASLVEKEAAGDDERAPIAGILWKRLDVGMILGVDAAVRYAVGKRTEPLTSADLGVDSPYNIRAKRGLPPGPIANPGLASIKAALHPETTPYFYYLHGTDGRIHYAVTNDEHNVNKAKYLR